VIAGLKTRLIPVEWILVKLSDALPRAELGRASAGFLRRSCPRRLNSAFGFTDSDVDLHRANANRILRAWITPLRPGWVSRGADDCRGGVICRLEPSSTHRFFQPRTRRLHAPKRSGHNCSVMAGRTRIPRQPNIMGECDQSAGTTGRASSRCSSSGKTSHSAEPCGWSVGQPALTIRCAWRLPESR